jgi:hypothetical protein
MIYSEVINIYNSNVVFQIIYDTFSNLTNLSENYKIKLGFINKYLTVQKTSKHDP